MLEGFDAAGAPKLRPAKRPITLRHLLTHTAGFSYDIWDANTGRYVKAAGRARAAPPARSRRIRTPLVFDPGDRWEYGINTDWAGRLVEVLSGQPLDVYFRDKIFAPLGMKDSGYVVSAEQRARQARVHARQADGALAPQPWEAAPVANPEFWSGGGPLYSTARDYLTFLQMLLHGGSGNGRGCSKPETVAEMNRNHTGNIPARHHEDAESRALERRRPVPRRGHPMGARLHAEHAAGAERPERRHGELGWDLQHLLLDRPGAARHRASS